jgi:glycosyltransferase involved in cell wall biosynthesis
MLTDGITKKPRVAVVHEWFVKVAGSEAVVEQILKIYPGADVFCMVNFLEGDDLKILNGSKVQTSFIQKLPFAKKKYRGYLPLMPFAVEQFDLSSYDLIISSSHAVAKGVITGPNQTHISYVHSPIRYAWDLQHTYLKEANLTHGIKSFFARLILHYIRIWDTRTSNGVDHFISNSNYIGKRIKRVYGRTSETIYPPVHLDEFVPGNLKEDFYLTASRFVPYKKIPLIVKAFARMPDKKLVVIGDGPEEAAAKALAQDNIQFLGHQPRSVLIDYMQRARGFVFAAEEDFGIVPVEAQGCGTPVIAFGRGGALESIIDGETGIHFPEQSVQSIIDAVKQFEDMEKSFDPEKIRKHALKFSVNEFRLQFKNFVERVTARI